MKNHYSYDKLCQDPFPIKYPYEYSTIGYMATIYALYMDEKINAIQILIKEKIIKFFIYDEKSEDGYIEIYSRPINRRSPIEKELYNDAKAYGCSCMLI